MYRVLIFFLLVSTGLYSQKVTISGTVKDASNGEDLIGATVRVKELNGVGASTNVYGFYSLSVAPGNYTLVYQSLGFGDVEKTVTLTENKTINIELAEATTKLKDFVVTDTSDNDANVREVQMSLVKLDPKSIETIPVLLGEADVVKTLQLSPGISSAGEGSSGFFVRGGGIDQNLILLDEAVVFNASHLLGFFSVFNSDAIKDVALYKGGIPAQYGGRGSSVMDITMRDGNNKKFGAKGGIGLISSRLTVEAPIVKDKGSFLIAGRRSYADLFLKFSADENLRNTALFFYDLNLKANYTINQKNRVYLSGYFGRDKFGNDAFGFDWGNATGTIRWNHLFSDKLFSNTTFIVSNYDYAFSIGEGEDQFGVKAAIFDYNFKEDFSYYLNEKNTIKFGLNAIHHTFSPGELSAENPSFNNIILPKRYALEGAVYLQNEQKISEIITLQYGLRYSVFNYMGKGTAKTFDNDGNELTSTEYDSWESIKFYNGLEPRFAAKYMLNDVSSIKASYNRNFQYIHLLSNTTSSSPTDNWVPSSNNVKPQIIDQVALGYFRNFKSNTYEFSVEGYYKNLQNQIDYRNGAQLFLNENVEGDLVYGKGIAFGTEFLLRRNKGKLTGWIGYTFSRAFRTFDQVNDGERYNALQDRIHDVSVVAMYKLSDRWAFSGTFVYNTGQPTTFPAGQYKIQGVTIPYYTDRNSQRFPDYHRMDIGATWYGKKTKKWKSSWTFSIYNLYARENAFTITFRENEDNPNVNEAVQTSLFRMIPSVTYNFEF